ncbi:hypothetical protein [Allokutzneria albata]|uniref:Butirosin biosynthesis protein H, N-terminal n=1 Tax=Allokutzneria albata TaxID=211114 RepID=A0A1G9W418_ALLAB|nr:hypothetical protein [Allokutzneria albata]SDM79288.1 hypothetical protein SAMN04489726_3387 [Allokutzneria albata]
MTHFPYVGSGPYCYSNSFSMVFGAEAPSTAVIETATGGPFGMQLIGGTLPFFDPYGWTPEEGFDKALATLGWSSTTVRAADADEALSLLRKSLVDGPVWAGPVDMGLLRHQPGMTGPMGADHYVVVIEVDDERVLMHDPHGFPYATLPLQDFLEAWRIEKVDYGKPFTMRTGFTRFAEVSEVDAIRESIPTAVHWLSMRGGADMPPGSLGNGAAAEALADLVEAGKHPHDHLVHFAVRVGARRIADAATCLARVGLTEASRITDEQARLIGSMQHPLVVGDLKKAADALRALAPTYDELLSALPDPPQC